MSVKAELAEDEQAAVRRIAKALNCEVYAEIEDEGCGQAWHARIRAFHPERDPELEYQNEVLAFTHWSWDVNVIREALRGLIFRVDSRIKEGKRIG